MSKSTHQIEIRGADKTGGAFSSIKSRAALTGAQIRSIVGGAIAAAGAYLSIRAIKGGIDELGHLSDIAQKTSTNVEELTKAATAMKILGVQGMGVDQLGKAFDFMAKATGRMGMEGFYQTIEELGKIPELSKRGQAAMKVFGRSGMEFMPLINAAKDGTAAFQSVIDAMPGVSQAAANSGDAISDAMEIAGSNIKKIWLNALSVICRNLDGMFAGGVREAVSKAFAYFENWIQTAWRRSVWFCTNAALIFQSMVANWTEVLGAFGTYFKDIFKAMGEFFAGMWNTTWEDWRNGKWFGKGPEMFAEAMEKAIDRVGKRLAPALGLGDLLEYDASDLEESLRKKLAAAEQLQDAYDKAVKIGKVGQGSDGGEVGAFASKRISNELIMGGSNAATRLQLLGPQLQSESKKQTSLLEKIATNTEKTAENTEESSGGDPVLSTDL